MGRGVAFLFLFVFQAPSPGALAAAAWLIQSPQGASFHLGKTIPRAAEVQPPRRCYLSKTLRKGGTW